MHRWNSRYASEPNWPKSSGSTNQKLRDTQAHLIHSEKMAGLGQLVAGIAHEINNPLAFVINNIFIVQESLEKLAAQSDELPPSASDKSRQDAGADRRRYVWRNASERTGYETANFFRLDEGTVKTINIHESIESVLLFLRHKMEGRIEVERHYGDVQMLTCLAGELNQVLMNIVANAIDAIEGPGRITLATEQHDGQFVIRVRDTGKRNTRKYPQPESSSRFLPPSRSGKALGSGWPFLTELSRRIAAPWNFQAEPAKARSSS